MSKQDDPLRRANEVARLIVAKTECPDPAEGGCIGGPIPGYGCVHEAATFVVRRLQEAEQDAARMRRAFDRLRMEEVPVPAQLMDVEDATADAYSCFAEHVLAGGEPDAKDGYRPLVLSGSP